MAARKFSRIGGNRPRTHPKSKPNVPAHSFGKPLRVLRNAKGHTREGLARRAPVQSSKKQAPPDDWIPDPLQDILETLTLIRATVIVCRSALRFEGFGDGEVEVVLKASCLRSQVEGHRQGLSQRNRLVILGLAAHSEGKTVSRLAASRRERVGPSDRATERLGRALRQGVPS